jgi:N4-gp56 family major capsid protein
MVLEKLGLNSPIPQNASLTVKWRRPRTFTAQTVPLVEGVTPKARTFRYDDVTATLKQYGEIIETTDVIEDTHEDPVLNDITVQAGENIGRTKEALLYAVLKAGTNIFYANGSARTDVNTAISLDRHMAVIRSLKAQKAMPITSTLDGSVNFKTTPIERGYVAVAHTDLERDLRALPGFVPTSMYGNKSTLSEHEIGAVQDCRFILSADLGPIADGGAAKLGMVSTTGTSADVYPILYFGKEAFGNAPLRGKSAVQPSIIPVGKIDKSDPLGQRGIVGWKMYHCAAILNDAWMARFEVAVTAI